jgi:hypothetical protein
VSTWQGTLVGACGVLNIRDAKGGIGSVSIGATPGTGYVAGDIVTVVNGFASGGKVLISAVSAGVPTTISVVSASPGFDYSIANNLTTTGGTGTGFTVNVLTITGQATCTVNVAVSTAAPTVGQSVTIADNTATEQARIVGTAPTTGVTGNVNVTLLMTLPHQAGSPVMFGGTAGGFAVFGGGLADPTTAPYTIALGSMPIGGAPDATHEYVVINYNHGPANGIIFPPATTSSIGTISCSAGAVTFPAGTVGGDLNVTPVGIQQYVVSGNSSSAMNGAVTGVVSYDDGSGSWTAPGGTCGGSTGGTGGTITLTHTADVFEYCGAEVTPSPMHLPSSANSGPMVISTSTITTASRLPGRGRCSPIGWSHSRPCTPTNTPPSAHRSSVMISSTSIM